ncbi:class I SAM-dependent methyltransferase [Haloprofundus salilacus]|uniref:class I SAM-dependent methyltransferase n=1 Tax=Haloprofundus salilacus TaxID=2876190 RepID=UPI001CCFE88E|nr:class I SAM-dependent methyltransferase [Haloprofundus salilacus]
MWPSELGFVCDRCGSRLRRREELRTHECDVDWWVDDDGIVRLLGPADVSEEMEALIAALHADGMTPFKRADKFESELCDIYPAFEYESWLNPDQADWLRVEPLAGKTVLELGGRYGGLTRSLAKRADHVVSVDANLDRLTFSASMRTATGTENLTLVHADATELPFDDGQFDAVTLNGLLKHVGTEGSSTDARRAQLTFLRRVRRWLRPGGRLLLSEWNRYDPLHLVAPAVPGVARDRLLRIGGRHRLADSGVRLHSERGYRKLLDEAGFRSIDVSYAIPDRRSPAFVFSDERLLAAFLKRKMVSLGACTLASISPGLLSRIPFPPGADRLAGLLAPAYKIRADAQ